MPQHRYTLRPAEFVGQRDDTRAGRWTAAIFRLLQYNSGDVLAGDPTFLVVAERAQFTAVDGESVDCDQRFVALRSRFGEFPQLDWGFAIRCIDEREHQIALPGAPRDDCAKHRIETERHKIRGI